MDDDRPQGPLGWVPDITDIRRVQRPRWATPRLLGIAALALAAIVTLANLSFQIKPEEACARRDASMVSRSVLATSRPTLDGLTPFQHLSDFHRVAIHHCGHDYPNGHAILLHRVRLSIVA